MKNECIEMLREYVEKKELTLEQLEVIADILKFFEFNRTQDGKRLLDEIEEKMYLREGQI